MDVTTEKLAKLTSANTRGLCLVRDELAGWLGSLDKYGGAGGDRAFFVEAYGGRDYVVDRVKDGGEAIRIPNLSVTVVGGIQPDRLATMLLLGDDDGMSARVLYCWPDPRPPTRPRNITDDASALCALRWLMVLDQDVVAGHPRPRVLPLDPDAADAIQAWRERVAGLEQEAFGPLPLMDRQAAGGRGADRHDPRAPVVVHARL